ncbi:MAG TPA: ABC transporter permease [Pyrinomonadaceae bacterium]|nr:ABC transporter permease [Chloracidobacterium sp.]HQX55219.1 ABC transporter permease [Pyrinomonadaceae bacterium]MBK7801648.1 ABC transporter permease [Chloracidobacterium sp.]MBK9436964.1 ABC transporter permease [Chloracidobacterium sp.]MBL0241958.1 ABC transporter permease [Chloracidobacterium sp.]
MDNVNTREDQMTVIGPRSRLGAIDLRELWRYRELLYFLTWRDVKIRYKQTVIGIAWAVLQPVVTTAIFTLLFSNFARFETGSTPYPVFALSALVIWLFVHNAITLASGSFVSNSNLVTKVYFPRLIVPLAATLSGIFDLIFSVIILIGLILYYGIEPTSGILLAPVFLILAFVMAAALGTLLSALNVKFRDVKFALPFVLQVWMIASPIFYPASMVSGRWRLAFAINPLTGLIDGFRSSLFGLPFDWELIGISVLSVAVMCVISLIIFSKMEDDFADVI